MKDWIDERRYGVDCRFGKAEFVECVFDQGQRRVAGRVNVDFGRWIWNEMVIGRQVETEVEVEVGWIG